MAEHSDSSRDQRAGAGGNGVGSHFDADDSYGASELTPEHHEKAGRAILHIAVILALTGALGGTYWWWVQNTNRITALVNEARELQKIDDYTALKKARAKYQEALAIRAEGRAIAGMAYASATLWGIMGDESAKADAEQFTKLAAEKKLPTAERYAAEAYMRTWAGDPAGAKEFLTAAMERGANDAKMLHALAVAYLAMGKTWEARELLRKGADLAVNLPRYMVTQGDAYLRDADYRNAWNFFNKAKIASVEHERARIGTLLATVKQGGKFATLAQVADKILADPDKRLSPVDRSFAEYTAAEITLARGRREQSRATVSAALAKNDKDARLHYLNARLLGLDGKLDDAVKEYDRAIELDPFTATYYFDEATLLRDNNRAADAVDRLRRYEQKNHASAEYRLALGMALADKGASEKAPADKASFDEAAKAFAAVLEDDDGNADALFGNGYVAEKQQKWEEARNAYGTADQNRQGWGDPYFRMGYVAIGEKDYGTARDYFRESLKRYRKKGAPPAKMANAFIGMAVAYEKEGKAQKAKPMREKADKLLKSENAEDEAAKDDENDMPAAPGAAAAPAAAAPADGDGEVNP